MAAPVTMTVDARGTIPRSVIRAAEGFHGEPEVEQYDGVGMELELANPNQFPAHESRCTCCPYGYHIDLDFLRYCESLNNGSYLRNLKKIKKNKRKLRKSMEVFLNNQQDGGPPPDVVHSTDTFMNYVEHEDIASRHLLDEIDSSVDNFDLINHSHRRPHYKGSGDYDEPDTYFDEYDSGSPSPGYNRQPAYHVQSPHVGGPPPRDPSKYRSETEMVLHQPRKSDSVSSLTSSLSEPNGHPSSGGEYRTTVTETEKRYKTQTHTYITAAQLAGQFAQLMPQQDVPALESAPESSVTPEALKAIREQMATSLQRLRELEEQVKIIPVLQVRLSVLKEERRLQELQLRAKNNKLNTRTIGVGECRIDDYDKPDGRSQSSSPSARMFEMTEFQSFNRKNLRRPNMRSFGVGDGNVFEQQQVAVKQQQYGWQDNRVHERELHTEESSHIMEKEKEVHTLVIGQEQNRLASIKRGEMRIPTRTIGTGSGNVFDTSSNVHVHEKEMRTVIIGGQEQTKKQHRNVGVSCRATMRDVGVMYYYEDVKPTTRNVAVGVGEGMMVGEFEEGGGGDSNTTVHQTLTSLQQMNMAAFHTRNINIKSEHLRIILDQMLKKNVHSVGTMCKMSTEDKGTSHDGRYDMVNVGCGTDTVEVDVRPVVATRSIGVEIRPALVSRAMVTDVQRTSNVGVNTQRTQSIHRATNTQGVDTFPVATNTEEVRMFSVPTETDNKIFQALDQIRNTGTNTTKVYTMNSETNTEQTTRNLKAYTYNSDVAFVDKGINTNIVKQTFSKGQTTDKVRTYSTGVGDHNINQHVDCDICLVKPQTKTVGLAAELKRAEEQLVQVKEQEQRQRAELTRVQQASAPGYTREMTIQSRVRGGSPGNTVTREITESTESKVRGVRRSSPSGMSHEQIMEHALGGGTANFEQMTEQILESQLKGEGSSTTEQIVERTIGSDQPKGRFTQEITIESRSGGTSRSPQVSREVITESHSSRGTTGAISGSLRDMLGVQRGISGSGEQHTSTETTEEVVERTVQSTPRYGQHVTKEVTISGRRGLGGSGTVTETHRSSGGSGGTSTREVTEEVIERRVRSGPVHSGGMVITKETTTVGGRLGGGLGGSSTTTEIHRGSGGYGGSSSSTREVTEEVIEQRVRSSPVRSGGTVITKEVTIGGRLGGSPRSTSSVTESSTSTVIQKESPGGVTIERKPSREERMKNYGVGATKVITSNTTTEEKTIEPRVRSTQESSFSSSSSSSSSSGSSSMSASTVRSGGGSMSGSSSMSASTVRSGGGGMSGSSSMSASTVRSGGGGISGSSSMSSSTVRSGGGGTDVQFVPDGKGGTQMRVVRHTETAYVGNNPVHSESDVVLAGIDKSPTGQQHHSGVSSSGGFSSSVTSSSSSSGGAGRLGGGQTITVTETKVERHGAALTEDESSLRSIMKKPGTSPVPAKKGIKFAAEVSAGFELSSEMKGACSTYAQWLEDSTKVTTKQLNSSVNQIQQEWFKVSSQKLSNPAQVEDFLSSFKEMSPDLLTQVVNMTDANGNSALHYAVSHCNTEVVNLLLDSGATDVDKQNKAGYTAVMLASLATVTDEPQKHAVGRLFQLGDVNARASQAGQTALMLAVSHGRTDMVRMLLESGADINVQDDDGSTALMCACEHGHTDLVKMILAHPECDPTVADNDGSTALSIAMEAGHRDVGVLLYAHVNFKQGSPC